ncbi:MAG: endonuclease/exonuclease/phosphatase family protein [Thermomicrobiales bacterium]
MRLISWNVSRAGPERIACQVAALAERGPEIVALQEVRINRVPEYRRALHASGFAHVVDGFAGVKAEFVGQRAAGVLIASRWECVPLPVARKQMRLPWPERLLSVLVAAPAGPVELHTIYVPTGVGPGRAVKAQTVGNLYTVLARNATRPRILCGDFNFPQRELADGTLITFGQTLRKNGAFGVTDAVADTYERQMLRGLAAYDLTDVYRTLHGYARQDLSWYHRASGNGFRLDHVLASRSLGATACRYLDHFRTVPPEPFAAPGFRTLSDHAAIEVDFNPEKTN